MEKKISGACSKHDRVEKSWASLGYANSSSNSSRAQDRDRVHSIGKTNTIVRTTIRMKVTECIEGGTI